MNFDEQVIGDAPQAVREFFDEVNVVPEWYDSAATIPGIRGFHANSDLILQAFIGGVLVEGFTTNISKSFVITGRLREQGVRRLRQNNRHVVEIFLPDGLHRNGDGWKLAVRIRLVHAQVRRLLSRSDDWEMEAWGTPLSAAHLALSASAFSARLLKHSESLGAAFSNQERESFMLIWRYSSHLMGVPDTILPQNEAEALRLYDIAMRCEPPIDFEAIIMANSLVNAVPFVVGARTKEDREEMSKVVYSVSRALIGNKIADQLHFPKSRVWGLLPWLRMQARIGRVARKMFPSLAQAYKFNNFWNIISASNYDAGGIDYSLPDHVYAEKSRNW